MTDATRLASEQITQEDINEARRFINDEWPSWDSDYKTVSAELAVRFARYRIKAELNIFDLSYDQLLKAIKASVSLAGGPIEVDVSAFRNVAYSALKDTTKLIIVIDAKGYATLHEPDEDGKPGDLVASVWRDDWLAALSATPAPSVTVSKGWDTPRIKTAIESKLNGIWSWLSSVSECDMEEIVADGGITAGMVVAQEAKHQMTCVDAALKNLADIADQFTATPAPSDQDASQAQGEVERIARLLCEQHGGDPDAVASEPHDSWDGPLWTVFQDDARSIIAALSPAPGATAQDGERGLTTNETPTPTIPAGMVGHERAGTAYDPGAVGHERQGRAAAPTPQAPVGQEVKRWQTGRDIPKVEQRHKDAAAWAMDRSPDGLTWDKATASHVTPERRWHMNRVAEAMARMERQTLASLNPTTGAGETEGGK